MKKKDEINQLRALSQDELRRELANREIAYLEGFNSVERHKIGTYNKRYRRSRARILTILNEKNRQQQQTK